MPKRKTPLHKDKLVLRAYRPLLSPGGRLIENLKVRSDALAGGELDIGAIIAEELDAQMRRKHKDGVIKFGPPPVTAKQKRARRKNAALMRRRLAELEAAGLCKRGRKPKGETKEKEKD